MTETINKWSIGITNKRMCFLPFSLSLSSFFFSFLFRHGGVRSKTKAYYFVLPGYLGNWKGLKRHLPGPLPAVLWWIRPPRQKTSLTTRQGTAPAHRALSAHAIIQVSPSHPGAPQPLDTRKPAPYSPVLHSEPCVAGPSWGVGSPYPGL